MTANRLLVVVLEVKFDSDELFREFHRVVESNLHEYLGTNIWVLCSSWTHAYEEPKGVCDAAPICNG